MQFSIFPKIFLTLSPGKTDPFQNQIFLTLPQHIICSKLLTPHFGRFYSTFPFNTMTKTFLHIAVAGGLVKTKS